MSLLSLGLSILWLYFRVYPSIRNTALHFPFLIEEAGRWDVQQLVSRTRCLQAPDLRPHELISVPAHYAAFVLDFIFWASLIFLAIFSQPCAKIREPFSILFCRLLLQSDLPPRLRQWPSLQLWMRIISSRHKWRCSPYSGWHYASLAKVLHRFQGRGRHELDNELSSNCRRLMAVWLDCILRKGPLKVVTVRLCKTRTGFSKAIGVYIYLLSYVKLLQLIEPRIPAHALCKLNPVEYLLFSPVDASIAILCSVMGQLLIENDLMIAVHADPPTSHHSIQAKEFKQFNSTVAVRGFPIMHTKPQSRTVLSIIPSYHISSTIYRMQFLPMNGRLSHTPMHISRMWIPRLHNLVRAGYVFTLSSSSAFAQALFFLCSLKENFRIDWYSGDPSTLRFNHVHLPFWVGWGLLEGDFMYSPWY